MLEEEFHDRGRDWPESQQLVFQQHGHFVVDGEGVGDGEESGAGCRRRIVVTPRTRCVDWLTCPSQFFPSGYSSKTFTIADSRFATWVATLKLMFCTPLPTDDELRTEVAAWLTDTLESEDE